ncbi:type II restriction enzyme [Candidatus Methanarcanum hacksteinii]|uniref:type II restriction enzyme n=1 Tax=Candidatus Methanarcanum hacksteinii TaxID=2911857 RepID=UPI0037DC5A9C
MVSVEDAWKEIFKKYDVINKIDKDGYFRITAKQINEYKESRLMTKFDEHSQMPQIFRNNKMTIISDSRGSYIIGRFALFSSVNYKNTDDRPIEPVYLETLKIDDLYNESSSMLYAYNSNMMRELFGTNNVSFTSYGRMGAGTFSFLTDEIDKKGNPTGRKFTINANKPQIEIDGAFETEESFFIVEAKNRYVEDINLRQIYYPYRLWSSKINKKVVPIFMVHSDKSFYFYVLAFDDEGDINSVKIVKSYKFAPADEPITMVDVVNEFSKITPSNHIHSNIFPQADKMEKIIDLLNLLNDRSDVTKDDITDYFEFDRRQTDYYLNAAAFLGYVTVIKRGPLSISKTGKNSMDKTIRERNIDLIKAILEDDVFYQTFDYLLKNGDMPDKEYVANLIRKYYPEIENKETPSRRAGTVVGWVKWILNLTEP